jgi:hypothetical protein
VVRSSAASDVYKRQVQSSVRNFGGLHKPKSSEGRSFGFN